MSAPARSLPCPPRPPLPGQRVFPSLEREWAEWRRLNAIPPRDEWPWIPELDLGMQAETLIPPIVKWGTRGRGDPNEGTYHFYTADRKFLALWDRPEQLPDSGCEVAVEVNYSTQEDSPARGVLWTIYRKRILAAYWQACGVRVVVDLNVDPAWRELSFVGVPRGWRSYAVRSQRGIGPDVIEDDHRAAVAHAGTEAILFVVFGGGQRVAAACSARGWTHVPEDGDLARGRAACPRELTHRG